MVRRQKYWGSTWTCLTANWWIFLYKCCEVNDDDRTNWIHAWWIYKFVQYFYVLFYLLIRTHIRLCKRLKFHYSAWIKLKIIKETWTSSYGFYELSIFIADNNQTQSTHFFDDLIEICISSILVPWTSKKNLKFTRFSLNPHHHLIIIPFKATQKNLFLSINQKICRAYASHLFKYLRMSKT